MRELYKIKDDIIVREDTGKELRTMKDIAEHMNWLGESNRYDAKEDDNGVEYIDYVGTYANYYDLNELCELCNCLWMEKTTKQFCFKINEKHMQIKKTKGRKHKAPHIWSGRFTAEHTARKGFWLEDWLNGKIYYFHIDEHIKAIVGLLNSYTGDSRYVSYRAKCGNVIKDMGNDEVYVLGDSKHIGELCDWLNWYDYQLYGERELPFRRLLL